jgi:hypothetical protein
MPGNDPDQICDFEGNNLSVAAASPRYLVAMKLLAARVDRDQDDIRTLYELCGFSTAEEGLRLLEMTYPSHVVAPRAQFLLQEMFRRSSEGPPGSSDSGPARAPAERRWRPGLRPGQTSGADPEGRC